MGDVSNYGTSEYGPSDYQTIMAGGANWMARMTAFLEAQERAQAATQEAQIVGDIVAARDAAREDREAAAKELEDALGFADGIVAKANAQADETLAKAREEAGKIVAAAKDQESESADRVKIAERDVQAKLDAAQATFDRAQAREADVNARAKALDDRAREVDAAMADAIALKAAYQDFAKKLRDVIVEEPNAGV